MHALKELISNKIESFLLAFPPSERLSLASKEVGHWLRYHGIIANILSADHEKPEHAPKLVHVRRWNQIPDRVKVLDSEVAALLVNAKPKELSLGKTESCLGRSKRDPILAAYMQE